MVPTNTRSGQVCVVCIVMLALSSFTGLAVVEAERSDPSGVAAVSAPLPVALTSRLPFKAKLAAGRFLVASRQLRDTNFSQTVVLLLNYSANGAMGLIINWPTDIRLATVLPEIDALEQQADTVYIGGPVARRQMLLLVQASKPPANAQHVLANLYVSASRELLQHLMAQQGTDDRFRVYAGHAGWAPGQLDREAARGDWQVWRADTATVFDTPASEIWPELIRRSSLKWLRFWRQPGDGQNAAGGMTQGVRLWR